MISGCIFFTFAKTNLNHDKNEETLFFGKPCACRM